MHILYACIYYSTRKVQETCKTYTSNVHDTCKMYASNICIVYIQFIYYVLACISCMCNIYICKSKFKEVTCMILARFMQAVQGYMKEGFLQGKKLARITYKFLTFHVQDSWLCKKLASFSEEKLSSCLQVSYTLFARSCKIFFPGWSSIFGRI